MHFDEYQLRRSQLYHNYDILVVYNNVLKGQQNLDFGFSWV